MGEMKARLENECSDLRHRLDDTEAARRDAEAAKDRAFSELSRLTLLLTEPDERLKREPSRRKWWQIG